MEHITLQHPDTVGYDRPTEPPSLPPLPKRNWFRKHPFITAWLAIILIGAIAAFLEPDSAQNGFRNGYSSGSSPVTDTIASDTGSSSLPSPNLDSLSNSDSSLSGMSLPTQDAAFILAVRSTAPAGSLSGATDDLLIELAGSICNALDAGASFELIGLTAIDNGVDIEAAGAIAGAAVVAYCPQHKATLEAFINRW